MVFELDELRRIVDLFIGIIDKNHVVPQFQCLYIQDGYCSGHNIETGAITTFDNKGINGMIPFDKFASFVKGVSSDVTITVNNDVVNLKAKRSNAEVPMEVGEYPTDLTDLYELEVYDIPDDFVTGIKLVIPFAASKKSIRPEFQGVHCDGQTIVATDNIKIAHFVMNEPILDGSLIISGNASKNISKLSPTGVYIDEKRIVLDIDGHTRVIGNILNSEYPDTNRIFPELEEVYELPRKDLIEAIENVYDFSGESKDDVSSTVEFKDDQINIKYEGQAVKIDRFFESTSDIPLCKFTINPHHFLVLLKNCHHFAIQGNIIYGQSEDTKFRAVVSLKQKK
jgi:DNA polymerase III sliding clamp (beta) subunit (PCNA family)